ncbi:SDR family NAD(P)-dependent oxidoreductase [Aciditerrimonas ferrireducens]|uniref:SDR family NAD(P)-dependent oxidoreductase n=1 Tax=Aciditerrimonas ferrireducens TaxID=667306 RepID=UPI002004D37A|nr:SDR family NAD(P)-dependent oxidoreductase [Aciditerrimonas ferrireducens]MCK4176955.1 SDR family NAD(P)-dependent oxidoreductase [Aciditerrimonas ferrireducens]
MAERPVALVTGASSGIGERFARLLAADGHDLVVVARRRPALEALARALHEAYGTEVEVLVADLASEEGLRAVEDRLARGPVETVVNNAGFGWYGPYWEQPEAVVTEMVAVNVAAVARVARAALGPMVARRRGGLLNVSSTASFAPGPRGALYHATKAFVTSLSEALHEEARPHGVRVTALCPGFTPTGFQERARVSTVRVPRFAVTDPDRVARAGLAALARNQALCVPGAANVAAMVGSQLAPRSVVRRMAGRVLESL